VEDLELKNKSLPAKWLYKLMKEDGMWVELLHKKYLDLELFLRFSQNQPPHFFECKR
jgi:hypothetical protein